MNSLEKFLYVLASEVMPVNEVGRLVAKYKAASETNTDNKLLADMVATWAYGTASETQVEVKGTLEEAAKALGHVFSEKTLRGGVPITGGYTGPVLGEETSAFNNMFDDEMSALSSQFTLGAPPEPSQSVVRPKIKRSDVVNSPAPMKKKKKKNKKV